MKDDGVDDLVVYDWYCPGAMRWSIGTVIVDTAWGFKLHLSS